MGTCRRGGSKAAYGKGAEHTLTKKSDYPGKSANALLDFFPTKVLMYVSDNEQAIHVMENPASISPTYYQLRRQTEANILAPPAS